VVVVELVSEVINTPLAVVVELVTVVIEILVVVVEGFLPQGRRSEEGD